MPRQAADLEEALSKKGGLTLSQLANYDDLITDALVDRVYYWSEIRKLKANYHACRGVQEEEVCKIVQQHAIIEKDPISAHKTMMALPGIAKYSRGLKTEDEKEHFERHLRKYINIYLPDCPFEVDTTNRYTILTAEACIKARKSIKKGEAIKYLSGIQVEMTEKEEKELSSRTDFSIVLSSRRKRPSLFLGPARFANHDCDSNARLNTTGPHGIHIVACKDIAAGDEITVTYGEDYFGIDNCECLCSSCESLMRNGWDPLGPPLNEDSSDEEEEEEEEEAIANVVKPKPAPKPELERPSLSTIGKRKRENDTPTAGQDSDFRTVKKRGRPRKYPRAEDSMVEAFARANRPKLHEANDRAFLQPLQLAESSSEEDSDEDEIPLGKGFGRFLSRSEDSDRAESELKRTNPINGRYRQSTTRERSGEPARDDLLEKIFDLLSTIGDRKLKEMRSRTATPKVASAVDAEAGAEEGSDAESDTMIELRPGPVRKQTEGTKSPTSWTPSPSSTSRSSPAYARGLSRSPGMEAESSKRQRETSNNANLVVPKAKLPAIQKERSVSSLRNVISAGDEEMDVYRISASPDSSGRRDGIGEAPTTVSPAEDIEDSFDSSSASISNNDSSSATSQTSSLTSLNSFAAGNIAFSICQMLTTDNGEETVEEAQEAADLIDIDDEVARSENAPLRGGRQLRKSPRKAMLETPTPAVQSIERLVTEGSSDGEEQRGPARTPGDYTLCQALLSTAYHRWVECRNCDEFFVQGDAYLTRIACPRCERHSKLYGYYWPKTDKEGKLDTEERVLDHRTIHRFIEPEEERNERKGRKTLADVLKEQELSSRQESEESDRAGVGKRLRNSPRRSESKRKMRMTM